MILKILIWTIMQYPLILNMDFFYFVFLTQEAHRDIQAILF